MATCAVRAYKPRHPRNTPLYRLVYHFKDEFLASYEELFESRYGPLRPVVGDVLERFVVCGDLRLGFARIRCQDCGEEYLTGFSCKCRFFCASCHQRRVLEWAEWLQEHVLEERPHRQVVLSLPRVLRPLFLRERKLLRELPGCAWRAMTAYFKASLQDKVIPGMVVAIQTFSTATLGWNPHLHALAAEGGWDERGAFQPLSLFDDDTLAELYRHEVFKMLLARQRITETTIDKMMAWRFTSGFSVHSQTRLSGCDVEGKQQLARYIARNPISLERMSIAPDGNVHYSLGKCRFPGDKPSEILHPLEFLARASQHIPDPYEPISFFYGRYSCRTRAATRNFDTTDQDTGDTAHPETFVPASHHEPDTPYRRECRKRWAQLIRKVYLEDPLTCSRCGGPMRVISFITDWPIVRKILDHLDLANPDPPEPVAHSPPADDFMHIP